MARVAHLDQEMCGTDRWPLWSRSRGSPFWPLPIRCPTVSREQPVTSNEQFRSDLQTTGISVGEPYPEGGYPPPNAAVSDYQQTSPPSDRSRFSATGSSDAPSTADVAKDEAASVAA